MKAKKLPEKYETCDWLWTYGRIGLTEEHIKRLNNAINILESLNERTDAKYLKEIKDKLLEDTPKTKKYIEKSALVAEIKKCYNICLKGAKITDSDYWYGKADAYRVVLASLDDTPEVKEVDLESEVEKCLKKYQMLAVGKKDFTDIAKNFFELGLKAQKGE